MKHARSLLPYLLFVSFTIAGCGSKMAEEDPSNLRALAGDADGNSSGNREAIATSDVVCDLYTYSALTNTAVKAPEVSKIKPGMKACVQMYTNVNVGQDGYTAALRISRGNRVIEAVANGEGTGSLTPSYCYHQWGSTYVWASIYKDGYVVKDCPVGRIDNK